MITIYGDKKSGSCLKILYLADYLGLSYRWLDIDILQGETRTEEFLKLNPAGQIPVIVLENERILSQSNAILLYLARDSNLVPEDSWLMAKVHQWLFWEQYSHEPTIAVCRFHKFYLGKTDAELDPIKVQKGNDALDLMDKHLKQQPWLVSEQMTVADIALVAYTRLAHEGGFDLAERTYLRNWISRVEAALKLE